MATRPDEKEDKSEENRKHFPLEKLPDNYLVKVFSNLEICDLHRNATRVSRNWHDLSKHKSLYPKVLRVTSHNMLESARILKKFNDSIRVVYCDLKLEDLLTEYLLSLIFKCPNLEKLCLHTSTRLHANDVPNYGARFFDVFENLQLDIKTLHLPEIFDSSNSVCENIMRLVAQRNIEKFEIDLRPLNGPFSIHETPTGLTKFTYMSNPDSKDYFAKIIAANRNTLVELAVDKLHLCVAREVAACKKLNKLIIQYLPPEETSEREYSIGYMESLKLKKLKLLFLSYPFLNGCFSAEFVKCAITHLDIGIDMMRVPFHIEKYDFDTSLNATNFPHVTNVMFMYKLTVFPERPVAVLSELLKTILIKLIAQFLKAALRFPGLVCVKFKNYDVRADGYGFDDAFYTFAQSDEFSTLVKSHRNLRQVVYFPMAPFSAYKEKQLLRYKPVVRPVHCSDTEKVTFHVNY